MTPSELHALGCQLGYGWQTWLAGKLRCDPSTVRSWLCGRRRIRPMVEATIREVITAELKRRKRLKTKLFR